MLVLMSNSSIFKQLSKGLFSGYVIQCSLSSLSNNMLLTNEKKENGKENRIAPAFLFFYLVSTCKSKRSIKTVVDINGMKKKGRRKMC